VSPPLSFGRRALAFAGVAYIYGIVLVAIALAWDLLTVSQHRLPELEWWQYLLAPLGIGLGAFALEWIGTQLTKGDDVAHPLWKRVPRLLVMFLFLFALILGPVFYKGLFQQ
jgi:hypothetical protein